jgi:MFS family permease
MTTESTVKPKSGSGQRSALASDSVREHLFRGAVGLTAAILAIGLAAVVGPISLVLLLVTVFAWRGCPTCWTVGLLGTLADNHARHDCSAANRRLRQLPADVR